MPNPKYTEAEKKQVIDAALQSIATGQSLNQFCKVNKYPYMTVSDWLRSDAVNSAREDAVRMGTHYLAGEAIDIVDAVDVEIRDKQLEGPLANAYISAAKARADIRLRVIGKWNRKDYGDKVVQEHTGANGAPLQMPSVTVVGLAPESKDGDEG